MKRLQLLSSITASLLLAGAAGAQSLPASTASGEAGTAPPAQRHAPAEKVAPPMHTGRSSAPQTTGQASKDEKSATTQLNQKNGASAEVKGSESTEMKGSNSTMDRKNAESHEKSGSTAQHSGSKNAPATTGQGAAAGAAKLSTEQRTKITTIIKRKKAKPAHLNISVHVGARLPAHVHFYPLPVEVVTIYPEWRGYDYIRVGDQILIVNPHTHLIVAILEA